MSENKERQSLEVRLQMRVIGEYLCCRLVSTNNQSLSVDLGQVKFGCVAEFPDLMERFETLMKDITSRLIDIIITKHAEETVPGFKPRIETVFLNDKDASKP